MLRDDQFWLIPELCPRREIRPLIFRNPGRLRRDPGRREVPEGARTAAKRPPLPQQPTGHRPGGQQYYSVVRTKSLSSLNCSETELELFVLVDWRIANFRELPDPSITDHATMISESSIKF